MRKIVIAIDGYSGCGKSSTAQAVAKRLGYTYVDSGAMYRAVTLYFLENNVDITDEVAVKRALGEIHLTFEIQDGKNALVLNGRHLDHEIRTAEVNAMVSPVSTLVDVRREMVRQQQRMSTGKGIVMDGRDIGTVVFPDAELKIFMTASIEVRAARRQLELSERGIPSSLEVILVNLAERDRIDSTRSEGPLRKANDAIEIDTSDLTFDGQVNKIVEQAERIIHAG
jgi:CMP/dCMP kinase